VLRSDHGNRNCHIRKARTAIGGLIRALIVFCVIDGKWMITESKFRRIPRLASLQNVTTQENRGRQVSDRFCFYRWRDAFQNMVKQA